MRKTKIICTIGPANEDEEVLEKMCQAGMNVARLNFSHGSHDEHLEKIKKIKKVREKLGYPLPIMLDTKGPEYRIRDFKNGKETLTDGQAFTFTTRDLSGDNTIVSVNYADLVSELKTGDRILVNNGLLIFEVKELTATDVICEVISGGEISDRKSMNFPNHVFKGQYLSDDDKSDLLFGIENDVDFVAASFVSNKENVCELRKFLNENGGKDIDIIAKIENRAGVDNIDEICEIADGIMVARGDLGVEIPFIEVPAIQKYLIKKCRLLGKRVITATEMLESVIHNPRPTRAEISDVANAVYDGSSAIMLSGESATGKYPVEAVRNMAEIAEYREKNIDTKAKGIVISSMSGITVRMVSRFRCPVDIIGITTSLKAWRKLNLSWGVTPVMSDEFDSVDVMFYQATQHAVEILGLVSGDNITLTGGQTSKQSGSTNTIRLETIK